MLSYFKANKNVQENNFELDFDNIPQHIAIIMDGNGRWAKARNLPRTMGHKAGVETIRRVIKEADRLGVKYITLYAFSTENWKRPKDEVNALMKLLVQYLKTEVSELHKNGVVLRVLGDINALVDDCRREEIIKAVKNIIDDVQEGKINKENINQELFSDYLYTKDSPDPDLIIRPSGEQRISNFLLWQCAYSEFWYSNVNWPDFSEKDLQRAIYDYQNRDRRFGGV